MTDRRRIGERRSGRDRRQRQPEGLQPVWQPRLRVPSQGEQTVQFLTRYLFCGLGLVFFNLALESPPLRFGLAQINFVYLAYFVVNTLLFLHMLRHEASPARFRLAMWVDVLMVFTSVISDPNDIPPSLLAFIMVVLGNGMRYGLRMFGEAVSACFGAAMVALTLRFAGSLDGLNPGLLFLNLFGSIILVYAYILMSRIERSREVLEERSRCDALTGLCNRAALYEVAEQWFERVRRDGSRLCVLFADMDKFKQVNDRHGHSVGDRVLTEFGHILKTSIRDYDLAARFGGDEFVLLLPGAGLDQAEVVALRIQRKLAAWAEDQGLECSLTIGVGEAPAQGDSLDALLHRVDLAMYASKGSADAGGIRRVDAMLAQPA